MGDRVRREIDQSVSNHELIQRITGYDLTEAELTRVFGISESALRKYETQGAQSSQRLSLPRRKLLVLEYCLSALENLGWPSPAAALKTIAIDDQPLAEFINRYAKDDSITVILRHVLKGAGPSTPPIERYRTKYKYLNDDTLAIASAEEPELLIELIEDTSLRPSTRGDILEALAVGARPEYLDLMMRQTKSTAPHIREAAYIGLFEYFESGAEYKNVAKIFAQNLVQEAAPGVRATLQALLANADPAKALNAALIADYGPIEATAIKEAMAIDREGYLARVRTVEEYGGFNEAELTLLGQCKSEGEA